MGQFEWLGKVDHVVFDANTLLESNLVQDLNFKSKLKQFQPVCLFETDVKDSSWLHISIRNDLDGITVM